MPPLNTVDAFSPPVVRVAAVVLLLVTIPAPDSDPMLTALPARSSDAPPLTVTAEFEPKALDAPADKVPELTVVGPV